MQNKYTDAISSAIKIWDSDFLREMQVLSWKLLLLSFQSVYFGCGKKCCDNREMSTEQVQSCIERCEKPVNAAQNLVQSELSQLQVIPIFDLLICSFISSISSGVNGYICSLNPDQIIDIVKVTFI